MSADSDPSSGDDSFDEKLQAAEDCEHGPTQVSLAEELVGLAGDDVARGFTARKLLVKATVFSNRPDLGLVAFSWLLGQSDKDPERFPESDLLWEYKWIADNLTAFPQITRAKIDATHDDMERRFTRCGVSLRPVSKLRCTAAVAMGDAEDARKHYRLWVDGARDHVSDCPACDQDAQVDFLVLEERDKDALERARPILEGRLRCEGVPHTTLSTVLLPLVRLGRWEEAAQHHVRGDRLVGSARRWVGPAAEHLRFLALTKNAERAQRLLDQRLPWALESPDLAKKLRFLLAARLHRALGGRVPLPDLDEQIEALSRRFDERNGNDHFAKQIARHDGLVSLARAYRL